MANLNERARARFAEDGYLILRGLLDPERDLAPLRLEYESLLDAVADRLHTAGVVFSTYADRPFGQRFCALAREMGGTLQNHLDICLPQKGVTIDTPVHCGPGAFGLLTNPHLLEAVEAFSAQRSTPIRLSTYESSRRRTTWSRTARSSVRWLRPSGIRTLLR